MPKPKTGNAKPCLPSFAARFIKSQNKNWKFNLDAFLDREFPPPPPVADEAESEIIEKTKKQFNVSSDVVFDVFVDFFFCKGTSKFMEYHAPFDLCSQLTHFRT